jgi:hydroxymethylglutaryl-CoA reductase (NADPH)
MNTAIKDIEQAIFSSSIQKSIPARGIYTEAARLERLQYLRDETNTALVDMDHCSLDAEELTGNIENLIGSVEIPVGIAGPLLINGNKANGQFFLPMATSEGALLASTSRGAAVISKSGGVTTRVLRQQMMRVPLFVLSNMHEAIILSNSITNHVADLQEQVRQVSQHAKLIQVDPVLIGNQVHVKFIYETGDAAGQNMTTTSTWHACQWFMKHMKKSLGIQCEDFWIEGNMAGDKKVNYQSFIFGRGTRVTAEVFIPSDILRKTLKVTPEQMVKCHQLGMAGACQSGMVGYNINTANVIAAIFAATGQDIACVHESSVAQLHVQAEENGIYASILLPSLVVGTVGGGTGLAKQQQLLDMMGCAGPGKVGKLAEIIASFCLALDISTMSAIISGQFASAHEALGRNKPVDWFTKEDLNKVFLTDALSSYFQDSSLSVTSIKSNKNVAMDSSIISELTTRKIEKYIGLSAHKIDYQSSSQPDASSLDVVIKVKPIDKEVLLMANRMASMTSSGLRDAHQIWKDHIGVKANHLRELAIYEQQDEQFTRYMPTIYSTYSNPEREAYVVIMEQLDDVILKDTADNISGWNQSHINAAIEGIARVHSVWFGRTEELKTSDWIGNVQNSQQMNDMSELWKHLSIHAAEEFPEWFIDNDLAHLQRKIRNVKSWWSDIDAMPKTLIHNDFNPRNICLRHSTESEDSFGYRLCAYDWELATIHIPQRDLAELLVFVLTPEVTKKEVDQYLEVHRLSLEAATGECIDPAQWEHGFSLSLCDFAITRFMFYVMAHTFRYYPFMERVSQTLRHLIRLYSKGCES